MNATATAPELNNVVYQFRSRLRAFIRSRVRDDPTADDLTQDVWIRVSRRLAELRDPNALEAWLYQIARNLITDFYRRQRPIEELPDTLIAPASETESVELHESLHDYVRGVVESLPEPHRQALWLTTYDGLTQAELSERLGVSLTAAKSRVQRARAEVRKIMERCCRWKFDRLGNIIDYKSRSESCGDC